MTGIFPGKILLAQRQRRQVFVRERDKQTVVESNFPRVLVLVYGLLFERHENAKRNSLRAGFAFLSGYASARKRKPHHSSASYVSGARLIFFSTGFGFWGLARTSPQFFRPPIKNRGSEWLPRDDKVRVRNPSRCLVPSSGSNWFVSRAGRTARCDSGAHGEKSLPVKLSR